MAYTKRKTPAARSTKRRSPPDTKASQQAKKQMWAVVLFASGILIGALTFIEGDRLWLVLHNFLFGVFGWSVFFFAPLIIYIAVMAAMDKPLTIIKNKLWQVTVLIILISAAIQIFGEPVRDSDTIPQLIKILYEEGIALEGGGVIGGLAAAPFNLFGKIGAGITVWLAIFVFFMLVTGSTLIGLFKSLTKPVKNLEGAYTASVEEREARRQEQIPEKPKAKAAAKASNRFNIDVDISGDTPIGEDNGSIPWDDEPAIPAVFSDTPEPVVPEPETVEIPLPEPVKPEMPVHPVVSERPATIIETDNLDKSLELLGSPVEYISPEEFAKRPPVAPQEPDITETVKAVRRHSLEDDIERAEQTATNEIDDNIDRFVAARAENNGFAESLSDIGDTPAEADAEIEAVLMPEEESPSEIIEAEPEPVIMWENTFEEEPELSSPQQPESIPAFADTPYDASMPYIYRRPAINLLKQSRLANNDDVDDELKNNAQTLVDTLKSFGVQTRITDICRGPAVTRYELQPSAGVKISKITGLSDDIALNLASAGIRIEAPIPNKAAVGIEVPNKVVSIVSIRELLDSHEFESAESNLAVALGRDIAGNITLADIAKMPHVLIAGSTGSGKSVCINSIIISLLYRSSPEDVKLLMIDPKVVELGVYNGIPHLLVPVVTDPKKAAGALNWAVVEMLRRYKEFAAHSVRDLAGYNRLASSNQELKPMPQIVIIIDELADLMMAAPNEVEDSICRLAQMARAAGMHLVIATQRPSVDVITGVIKANIPSRVAFAVSSQVDSRTILDMGGAEKLLGRGDMLFYPVGAAKPQRVQGCFVTDTEVESVVEFIKLGENAQYDQQIVEEIDSHVIPDASSKDSSKDGGFNDEDEMLPQAIECVVEAGMASTSQLQRRLKLGYARAARIIDQLEERGIVGPFEGSKPRQVLMSKDRWMEMKLAGAESSALGKTAE